MRPSLVNPHKQLPESEEDFEELRAMPHQFPMLRCIACSERFSSKNTRSRAAWRETQITGMCENCFDDLWRETEPGVQHDN